LITSLIRSIVLARLLAPEDFGVYVFALSVVTILLLIPNSWLSGPFLHHSEFSKGEKGASTHFTLNLSINLVWLVLTLSISSLFLSPNQWPIFAVLLIAGFFKEITNTHRLILVKRVLFKRIALIELIISICEASCAIALAYLGFGVWSLVSINVTTAIVSLVAYFLIKPVWRMRFSWQRDSIRYFYQFGRNTFVAGMLGVLLDRVDDLWTGYFLGPTALGYYSRAYQFATYPRKMLAQPLNSVAAGTYAELKGNRSKLSSAFQQFNTVIVRAGFAVSGLLVTIAPEFIQLLLGEKWMPMLETFRLMLVFSMFDPMVVTVASVLVAEGKPNKVGQARFVQLVVLIIGMIILAPRLGITGVALAVDIMLFVGISLLFYFASHYVDFSLRKLFLVPLIGLIIGFGITISMPTLDNLVVSMIYKAAIFGFIYLGTLMIFEWKLVKELFVQMKEIFRARE